MILTGGDLGDIHPSVERQHPGFRAMQEICRQISCDRIILPPSPLSAVTRTTRSLVWNTSEFFWTNINSFLIFFFSFGLACPWSSAAQRNEHRESGTGKAEEERSDLGRLEERTRRANGKRGNLKNAGSEEGATCQLETVKRA